MSTVKHESIIEYIEYRQFNFKGKLKPTYIMEYAKNGSLRKVINYEKQNFAKSDWNNTKKYINIHGIASVMRYLHSLDIIHRDLKSDNIILDEHLYPKLTDFGFSKKISEHYENTHLILKGTPYYIAPEIYKNYKYSKASDVFAFGMALYEIVTSETKLGKFKNGENIMIEVIAYHYRPPMKKDIPECYKKLIESCWSEKPEDRPTFEEIVDKLKSDPSFMFDDVNLDEIMLYMEIIGDDYANRNSLNKPQIKLEEDIKKVSIPISEDKINQNTINTFNKIFEDEIDDKTKSNFYLDINNYKIIELVKKGEFNKVYKVIEKRTGKLFAARISNINMTEFSVEEMKTICNEFHRMSKLKHQSILRILGFSPKDYKNRSNPVFITELTFKKSLQDVIQNERENMKYKEWNATKKIINIYGIASGMKYLHSHDILHRNLKSSNILLDDLLRPKLSDFGFCNQLLIMNSLTLQSINKIHNSSCYQAPEVMNSGEYTKASDVYSFAMITYEIITNDQPFIDFNDFKNLFNEVVIKGARPKFNRQIPNCYSQLIENCWCQNPNERLTFDQIIDILKNESSFITSDIDHREFSRYVDKDSA
ncbi:hypothetical protein M9Y10_016955 [Tritrichomonas musculus]|uniref:Protein kinase domain-containing protein n=1 Tax=Tritrichomonas musculus TaxID=1915356 RepID=A0ABR2HYB8_9EUKA